MIHSLEQNSSRTFQIMSLSDVPIKFHFTERPLDPDKSCVIKMRNEEEIWSEFVKYLPRLFPLVFSLSNHIPES